MASKGYTTVERVITQLGRSLTPEQVVHLNELVIPAAEQWIDEVGGRSYGEGVVTAEQLLLNGSAYTWLSRTPVLTVDAVRGWYWGQTVADVHTLSSAYYNLVDPRIGYFRVPLWRNYAYLEVDYTPDPTIPERIKLACAILSAYYMRTVIHPQTEWLTEYASGQDVRFKFREMEVPSQVHELIGGSDSGYVVA